MKKQTRSEARDAAFTQVFQMDLHEGDMDVIMDELLKARPECEQNIGYINAVVCGVREHADEIDALIEKNLRSGWSLSRISKAARTALRIAIYEIKYLEDVPEKVAANEAVEIAKRYGSESDPSFVNGVLSSVIKEIS